jgi:hypothetical protein
MVVDATHKIKNLNLKKYLNQWGFTMD